jgi:hypothetical protein
MNVMGFNFGAQLTEEIVIRIMKQEFSEDVTDKHIYITKDGDNATVSGFGNYIRYIFHSNYDTCTVIKSEDDTIVDIRKEVLL